MLRRSLILISFILITSVSSLMAQKVILDKSDELVKKGQISEAYKLMQKNTYRYLKNVDFVWKIAQLAYWNKDITSSKKYYNLAIKLDPTNYNIKLDFAKILFELGDYKESIALLNQYLVYDNSIIDIHTLLIKAAFYDGQVNNAQNLIEKLPPNFKSSPEIIQLKQDIAAFKSINIATSISYTKDDQPLKTFNPRLKISKQESHLLNWSIGGSFYGFNNDTLNTAAQTLQLGNLFHFRKLKLDAHVFLGATLSNYNKNTAIIGGLMLSKKITNGVAIELEAMRNPYFYSLPSTQVLVTQDNLGVALVITDIAKFSGKLQLQQQIYNDKNKINSVSGWVLSPSIGKKSLQAKIGFSFDDTDAETDNYRSIKSLNEVIQNYANNQLIDGIFDPYFTPNNQKSQNALLWLLFKPTKYLDINFTGTYALNATFENPIIFLSKNNSNQTIFDKQFIKQKYKPASYKASIIYDSHKKFSATINYEYFKTSYYAANTFMLSLNYRLIHEK